MLVTLIVGARFAHAQRSVPPGHQWWCAGLSNLADSDGFSTCFRTEALCEQSRQLWLSGGTEFDGREASECATQRNAAVVWHFNVMQERDFFSAAASMRDCRGYRAFLLGRKGDIERVSQCKVVGATQPPRPNRKDVPRGKGWSCYAFRAPCAEQPNETCTSGRCFRTSGECGEQLALALERETVEDLVTMEIECRTAQKRAHVLTLAGQAHAYPTGAGCVWAHVQLTRREAEPSRCEALP